MLPKTLRSARSQMHDRRDSHLWRRVPPWFRQLIYISSGEASHNYNSAFAYLACSSSCKFLVRKTIVAGTCKATVQMWPLPFCEPLRLFNDGAVLDKNDVGLHSVQQRQFSRDKGFRRGALPPSFGLWYICSQGGFDDAWLPRLQGYLTLVRN